jgi:hypothetical protein
MYGALRLSQSPAVIMASPRALQAGASHVNIVIEYLIVVPALLAFLELAVGGLRVLIQVAAWIGLAIGVTGILVSIVTSSSNALMPYNHLLAACVLLILMIVVAVPRLSSSYLVFNSRVLVVGTFGFAVEALYNNVARPMGFWSWITSASQFCCSPLHMSRCNWSSRTSIAYWRLRANLKLPIRSRLRFFRVECRQPESFA